jgi:hypothetical protein
MKLNKWTVGLVAVGAVSFGSVAQADESEMSVIQAATSGVTIGGYVSTSFRYDLNTAVGGNSADPIGAGKANGFNLDVVNLTIEKPLDESEWAAGYKAEILAGSGADVLAIATTGDSNFAIKQAYVNLRAPMGNGLEVKMGVFDTVIGYEAYNYPANPNYTRSLGWALEPTQHTGLLATYRVSDIVSISGGLANRWDATLNAKPGNTNKQQWDIAYLGSLAVTAPEDMGALAGSSLYIGAVYGENAPSATAGGALNHTANYYAGVTLATGVEGLSVGGALDYRDSRSSGYAAALAGYLSFQATEKLSLHGRAEYGYGTIAGTSVNPAASTENKGQMWAFTATGQYDLWQNVITRLEYRWASFNDPIYGDSTTPTLNNAHMLALNVIYQF